MLPMPVGRNVITYHSVRHHFTLSAILLPYLIHIFMRSDYASKQAYINLLSSSLLGDDITQAVPTSPRNVVTLSDTPTSSPKSYNSHFCGSNLPDINRCDTIIDYL